MECLNMNFTRKLELLREYTFPYVGTSDRIRMKNRRLPYSRHCSASYRESQCRISFNVIKPAQLSFNGHKISRAFAEPISLGEDSSSLSEEKNISDSNEILLDDASEDSKKKLTSDELKALMLDTERRRLLKKLSEANQYNRYLKRQLLVEEDALAKYKIELAVLELELQALVSLAEEIANTGVPVDSRMINGKYIQSHLLARLEVVHEKVKEQIKDVDTLKFEEVTLLWVGMAEGAKLYSYQLTDGDVLPDVLKIVCQSVQVMGSFDGWSEGEEMSPEYTGDFSRFFATLKLRPGRYEIKFLVDGEWQLSSELPTIGEGFMQNNLLVVGQAN